MKADAPLAPPPRWSTDRLEEDLQRAVERFRVERTTEPLERYLSEFAERQKVFESLFQRTKDLAHLRRLGAAILDSKEMQEAVRYLAGPPISEDDLKTLASASSMSPGVLAGDPNLAIRVLDTIVLALDRQRFPWVLQERKPTASERSAALLASAALVASKRVETARRNEGKEAQETLVCQALSDAGFEQVESRMARTHLEAPGPGEFCRESQLGTRKADLLVGLWDRRVLPIECKVSNSATNSIKRLNNDAAVKAEVWRKDFGELNVVPAAVLAGVFHIRHLVEAQHRGLAVFWAHDMESLVNWIATTKEGKGRPRTR
ncbi:MAG: XamI family restriction endonuclease [Polyangiaceae bacterium]|nr:XamI family restriction endonuclease [Polyangiaceae bacterium]